MSTNNGVVWKYPINAGTTDVFSIDMPAGASILHFGNHDGAMAIWAIVSPERLQEARHFRICGTGHRIEYPKPGWEGYGAVYVGTVFDGPFVWHLFEILQQEKVNE